MKYLLDTANLDAIRYYTDIFPIAGVTSNPSIVKKEGKIDFFAHMNEIRSIIGMDKTLHIQVTALDTDGMLRDAETILNKVDDQVCVKVPVTLEGIKAIKTLKKQDGCASPCEKRRTYAPDSRCSAGPLHWSISGLACRY